MLKKIKVSPMGAFLDAYIDTNNGVRDGILIFPGGGYGMVCEEREGSPIAKAFLDKGVNAFVLTYSVGEDVKFPTHLTEAALAMKYIKDNAQKFSVNPDRIFVLGFSAGGHLAGSLSTMYNEAEELLGFDKGAARPAGTVYCYPVVSAYHPTHGGSIFNLTGKNASDMTEEEKNKYSIEKRVKSDTPPAFIWHTVEDRDVPIIGSIKLLESYIENGVPVTAHIYPYGPHGMALANELTSADNPDLICPLAEIWVDYAVKFFKTL